MALKAVSALAWLALFPYLVAPYSFELTAAPKQCGNLSLKIVNGQGNPPYTAVVMPYGASTSQQEQRKVFNHQFSASSTSFQLPYPANSNFIIMVGDRDGPGSGGTGVPTSVGSSADSSCLPSSVSAAFAFEILPTTAINQCTPVILAWNSSAQDPVNIILAIPGGQSRPIDKTNVGVQDGGTTGFTWVPDIRALTNVVLIAGDARGIGSGGSVSTIVGFSSTNNQSCIGGNSPSSTAGTPAGAIETGSSGSNGNNNGGNTGAIAGGIVGGVVALIIGCFLVWFFLRRRRMQQHPAAHGVDLLPEGAQRDPDQLPEFYHPEPFVVPPSLSGYEDDTRRPSTSDQRYSAVSVTDNSESVFLGPGVTAPSGSTSYTPTSGRKTPAGPPVLRPVNFVQHEDAGEAEEGGSSQDPETIELPPSYTSVRK